MGNWQKSSKAESASSRQLARLLRACNHGVDYLSTWNRNHIANAATLPGVYRLLRQSAYTPPLFVTPEEFSGDA